MTFVAMASAIWCGILRFRLKPIEQSFVLILSYAHRILLLPTRYFHFVSGKQNPDLLIQNCFIMAIAMAYFDRKVILFSSLTKHSFYNLSSSREMIMSE